MKKLIVNTGTLTAGGAERVLSVLSYSLADIFEEVIFVMWLDAEHPDIHYDIDRRVKILRLSQMSRSQSIIKQSLWYRKFVKSEKPDLVLSFMVMVNFAVTLSLLFSGTAQIVAERNDPRYFKRKWLRKLINWSYLTPDVKGIIVQTQCIKDYFKKSRLYKKCDIIKNPLFLSKDIIGAALNTAKTNTIVSIGRLKNQKQHWVLLEAFAVFYRTHPSYKLIIYGDGELRSFLLNLAEELHIKDAVSLPGISNNLHSDILSAKMFVMTSRYEGMSNALAEALCLGLPCISTKVSGADELIEEGVNGFLVHSGDIHSISRLMEEIVDTPQCCNGVAQKSDEIFRLLNKDRICKDWTRYLESKCIS